MKVSTFGLLALLSVSAPLHAQLIRQLPISIHPAQVARDSQFLLLLQDYWTDGCGGSISVRVEQAQIDVTATATEVPPDVVCTQAIVPFRQLINPRDFSDADIEFADSITINYFFDNRTGPELRQSESLRLSDGVNPGARVQTGSWVTSALESSGLFIDQQGDLLSAALLDYGSDGQSEWRYAAGEVNGDVFVADLVAYSEIVCVTQPCPRAAPAQAGRINMLIREHNDIVVGYSGLEDSGRGANGIVADYSRLDFARNPALVADLSRTGLNVPDLSGEWLGGISSGPNGVADLHRVQITYLGTESMSGFPQYHFEALGLDKRFTISCSDRRPVDGIEACSVGAYTYQGGNCGAFFPFTAVGEQRVSADASCVIGTDDLALRFDLFKLD